MNIPYDQSITTNFKYAFPDVEKAVLSPRFGFAYSPDSNTVFRGGFGIFDDSEFPALAVDRSLTNAPAISNFSSSVLLANFLRREQSVFADAANANAIFQSGFASGLTFAGLESAPNYLHHTEQAAEPEIAEWNLEVQRQLGTRQRGPQLCWKPRL